MKALNLLLEALKQPDAVAQAEAARLLGEAAVAEAVAPLLDYVKGSLHFHKSAGFTALGRIGDVRACDEIFALIDDPRMRDDWYWFGWKSVRAAAAHALLMLGDARGAEFLTVLADKRDDVFYSWFAPAILQLPGVNDAVTRVKARLSVESLFDAPALSTRLSDSSRLTAVVEALGWIGGDTAAEKAAEFLDHRSRFVRGQAALSVKRAGGSVYDERLSAVAASDATDFVKAKVAVALGDGKSLAELARETQDPFERAVAVEGLGIIGAIGAAGVAVAAMEDPDAYVRQSALEALEQLDPTQAVLTARKAIEDTEANVRRQAAKTLIGLERRDA